MGIFEPISEITTNTTIAIFSQEYFVMVGMSFAIILFLLIWGYLASEPQRKRLLNGIVITIVLLEVVRQIWLYTTGPYQISWMLPLHLCGLQIFLMPLMRIRKTKFWENFIYFTAVPGGLGAILFNDITLPYGHWLVIQSYVIHALILCVPIYMLCYTSFKPDVKYVLPSALWLIVLAIPIYFVNQAVGSNYMYLSDYVANSPMEYLYRLVGSPGYILLFYGIFIFLWILMSYPFNFYRKKRKGLVLIRKL